jgi:hypothetical protein
MTPAELEMFMKTGVIYLTRTMTVTEILHRYGDILTDKEKAYLKLKTDT